MNLSGWIGRRDTIGAIIGARRQLARFKQFPCDPLVYSAFLVAAVWMPHIPAAE
jgi:hypothetical protein